MKLYPFQKTALTLALMAVTSGVWAQSNAGADAQRSIQESQSKLPAKPAAKPIAPDLQDFSDVSPMARLDVLDIKDDALRPEIEAYFKRFMGKPVTEEEMIAFKGWVNDTAKAMGFMAYAQTDVEGNKLHIRLVLPRINSVKVFTRDEALANLYLKDLNARFEADFKPGMPVDILSLEQKLDAVSFSLPLELDVVIRSAGPELLDLLVNVTEAPSRPWEMLGGLVQTNNYGLRQFGKAQVLGQVSFGGHLPSSRLTLTGQKSQGITYVRSEYDMPVASWDSRFRMGLGHSRSEGIRGGQSVTQSQSNDLVMGLEKILGHRRELVFKGAADLSTRQSRSELSSTGVEVNRVQDHQLRLRLSADSDRLSNEPMRAEVTAVVGHYATLVNFQNVPENSYTKLEFNARKQFNLSEDGKWYGLAKVRGQRTSQHMEGSNQMSLGGANGVRAYSTADGLGDDALLTTLEFNYKYQPNQTWGVFYDGGVVRASKKPLAGIFSETYALQAVGLQTSGNVNKWYYNVAAAKGFGGNKGALPSDIDSKPNNWRLNASLTFVF
ncbi:ShlB/FhaC/HecB family hemolysin secretion/activation protein [Limnohabitans sp. 15K]|uniref:ShlB/FhaC/HecB family hemolysin secretion/activation protein n=1 Tax=Limnohabitans sp. 15K TaxID=1100706 RepID=UPI000C1F3AA2|nr:ShlB/FhaC/HecB family hemolysin secretion/activation protein [Limnohabitans sp. 15K]